MQYSQPFGILLALVMLGTLPRTAEPLEPDSERSGPQQQEPSPPKAKGGNPVPKPGKKASYWEALLPKVTAALKSEFPNERIGERYPVRIVKEADITGDGTLEAIVTMGDGGAYTDYLTLMRIEAGEPVVALFKGKDGKPSYSIFLQGASVRHGTTTEFLPGNNAIYSGGYDTDDEGVIASCGVAAYQWNAQSKTFDLSEALSKKASEGYCQRMKSVNN